MAGRRQSHRHHSGRVVSVDVLKCVVEPSHCKAETIVTIATMTNNCIVDNLRSIYYIGYIPITEITFKRS